ncbi:MAG: YdiU family protein [Synechococcales bacterium]|nr:YdiU family protein [Synechococcales bacterium]
MNSVNPILALNYEPAIAHLGEDYFDEVTAAEFPTHILRWRNNSVLQQLGLDPQTVTDADFIAAFGKFQDQQPLLALRYHGYQFGDYNPNLGDGRGFLYGQVRGQDGMLYDLGTKGSGTTPYSRGGDGRLTLKGGVREVLAAEMLHRMGVRTSRCLSMIETGEQLWRGDEPSPTRSSVMIRVQQSHIRFGTFERLDYLKRRDLIAKLLDHVIEIYYPHLAQEGDRYGKFYGELTQRVAELVAQWMAAGFCHAVLNTDNMSITGESFDYGPYAFIPRFNPKFTAAYFDYFGRYCYANQPMICKWNLEMLQVPLKQVISKQDLEAGLAGYDAAYGQAYRRLMLEKLGFAEWEDDFSRELLRSTLEFLQIAELDYHDFFWQLTQQISPSWRSDAAAIFPQADVQDAEVAPLFEKWRTYYHKALNALPESELLAMVNRMRDRNPEQVILRPVIESVWAKITEEDDWQPFDQLLDRISQKPEALTSLADRH